MEDALKLLNESEGSHSYEIFIPSLNKEINFKPLKVGQQKTLSKYAMSDNEYEFNNSLNGLIKSICLTPEDLDFEVITEIDKIIILSEIKKNNILNPLKLKITCNNCESEFNHEFNFDTYTECCKKAIIGDRFEKIEFNGIKYEFILSIPSLKNTKDFNDYSNEKMGSIKKLYKKIEEKKNSFEDNILSLDEEKVLNYSLGELLRMNEIEIDDERLILYVKSIRLNGNEVSFNSINEKIEFFNKLPNTLLDSDDEKSIKGKLLNDFSKQIEENIKYPLKCFSCGIEMKNLVRIESFFE
jgi:hypothetical protein